MNNYILDGARHLWWPSVLSLGNLYWARIYSIQNPLCVILATPLNSMQLVYSCIGKLSHYMLWMYCYIILFEFVYKTSYCIGSYVINDIHWLNRMIQNNGSAPNLATMTTITTTMTTTNNGYHDCYQQWLPWLLPTMATIYVKSLQLHNQKHNVQKLSHYNDVPYTRYFAFIKVAVYWHAHIIN